MSVRYIQRQVQVFNHNVLHDDVLIQDKDKGISLNPNHINSADVAVTAFQI